MVAFEETVIIQALITASFIGIVLGISKYCVYVCQVLNQPIRSMMHKDFDQQKVDEGRAKMKTCSLEVGASVAILVCTILGFQVTGLAGIITGVLLFIAMTLIVLFVLSASVVHWYNNKTEPQLSSDEAKT